MVGQQIGQIRIRAFLDSKDSMDKGRDKDSVHLNSKKGSLVVGGIGHFLHGRGRNKAQDLPKDKIRLRGKGRESVGNLGRVAIIVVALICRMFVHIRKKDSSGRRLWMQGQKRPRRASIGNRWQKKSLLLLRIIVM